MTQDQPLTTAAGSNRAVGWVDSQSTARLALILIGLVGGLFAATAEWDDTKVNVDAVASALPAWSLAQHGTIDLPPEATANPWVTETPRGTFSNRPPGAWIVAVPAYWVLGDAEQFSTDPSTWTAVIVTTSAMLVLFVVLSRILSSGAALAAVAFFALGTATWPISSSQLWPHGTGQLAAALGLLGLMAHRYSGAGAGFGFGILVRPPTAIFAAVTGIGMMISDRARRIKALIGIGGMAAAFLVLLMTYNYVVFGSFGWQGGYSSSFGDNLLGMEWSYYLTNLANMFVLPPNGIIYWSPIVAVAAVATWRTWAQLPDWARWSAVAGLIYLLVVARMNRASGGLPFNYRYPLEPLMMAAPAMIIASVEWFRRGGRLRLLVLGLGLMSVALQALYTFALVCEPGGVGQVSCHVGF